MFPALFPHDILLVCVIMYSYGARAQTMVRFIKLHTLINARVPWGPLIKGTDWFLVSRTNIIKLSCKTWSFFELVVISKHF